MNYDRNKTRQLPASTYAVELENHKSHLAQPWYFGFTKARNFNYFSTIASSVPILRALSSPAMPQTSVLL